MAYFNICPVCGANLDPNEQCDCINRQTVNADPKRDYEEDTK